MLGIAQNGSARRREKRCGSAHPCEVTVVIYAHHFTAAHAHDERTGAQLILPDKHYAQLRLGEAMRSVNDRFEAHALLQNKFVTASGGNRGQIVARGTDYYAEAGEGVQRLENVVVEAGGERIGELIEKPTARHGGVMQIGKRKLADAEKPVGVAGPFHVKFIGIVEGCSNSPADEFVGDHAIVDAINWREFAIAMVEQALPPPPQ